MRLYRWLFVFTTVLAGITYWWQADWWAYVDYGTELRPKFVMPWWCNSG
jgi:hypothetical protein